jgi:hypothetical protein
MHTSRNPCSQEDPPDSAWLLEEDGSPTTTLNQRTKYESHKGIVINGQERRYQASLHAQETFSSQIDTTEALQRVAQEFVLQ